MTEKKVVIQVQFEFYPAENEAWSKQSAQASDEELTKAVQAELEQEFNSMANDGLWWHFENAKVITNN